MPGTPSFLLISVCSGAAALLYEVLWLRLLTLTMGHTAGAVGTVLAAFMGGLAVGAWLGGRVGASLAPVRALRAYASLELIIAGCALLLPAAWSLAEPLLRWAYHNGEAAVRFDLTRIMLSLLLIFVPAVAMGATYPLAVRWFAVRQHSAAADAGRVYAANTVGAAAGVLLAGFVLLPLLGLRLTTLVGVALNATAAIGALAMASRARSNVSEARAKAGRHVQSEGPAKARRHVRASTQTGNVRLAAAALGVSGFVALVYEVTWTRILAMVLGPTTYAFSTMLAAFITGLAIGSAMAAALVPRVRHAGMWLGIALIGAAAAALASSAVIDRLPLVMASAVVRPDTTFGSVVALQIALGIVIQLPMTVALGAAFPFAVALAAPSLPTVAWSAAVVYVANTIGAIAGALAGSFLVIPVFGLQTSIRIASVLAIVAGCVVCWRTVTHRAGRVTVALVTAGATLVAVALPLWNHERLANGAYRSTPALAAGDVQTGLEAGRLLYYREGAAGTVSVRELIGERSLAIDGKVDASNAEDMLTQKLLAHLPLLLHDAPRRVLIIGLGSGVTLGAALRHPLERADVVEISPQVVAASELFAHENHQALADPRSRLILGDGRSHLLLATERYDVIISEPSNPWMSGVAALFTGEFFLAARDRLAPGGILCQWAHTYNISDDDLRSIVATFLSAFPRGSAWLVGESDLLLIGSSSPLRALDQGLDASWQRPGVAADLAEVSVRDPFSLLTLFVARGPDLYRYADNAVVQSDDRLSLEYSAPRAIHGRFQQSNVDRLRDLAARAEAPPAVLQAQTGVTAAKWRDRGLMRLQAAAATLAFDDFRRALEQDPQDARTLDGLTRAAALAGRFDDAEVVLRKIAASSRSAQALVELSRVLAARGRSDDATNVAREAALLQPDHGPALEQLASMYAERGDAEALEQLVHIVERSPAHRAITLYGRTRLALLHGDFERAAQFGEELVGVKRSADAYNLLGAARAELGQYDRARQAFETSRQLVPRDAGVLANLGTMELRSANPAAAVERFSEALLLRPRQADAREGLAQAFEQLGDTERAAAIRGR